jgi:hypothetical protein
MALKTRTSKIALATLAVASALCMARGAEAQNYMASRRADPEIQRQCVKQVERRLPGSDTSTNLEYNKNAMYLACIHNGGTIPGWE